MSMAPTVALNRAAMATSMHPCLHRVLQLFWTLLSTTSARPLGRRSHARSLGRVRKRAKGRAKERANGRAKERPRTLLVMGLRCFGPPLSMSNTFRALGAARAVVDEISYLFRDHDLLYRGQLRDSAQSIPANIREGIGRAIGPDRNKFYRVARGSAEETDEHLRANFADGRIAASIYWRLHNRLIVIVKMLNALMN